MSSDAPPRSSASEAAAPRWTLAGLSLLLACVFGWAAKVLPWHSWTLFAAATATVLFMTTAAFLHHSAVKPDHHVIEYDLIDDQREIAEAAFAYLFLQGEGAEANVRFEDAGTGRLAAWVGGWSLALIGLFNIGGSFFAGWAGQALSKKWVLSGIYLARAAVIGRVKTKRFGRHADGFETFDDAQWRPRFFSTGL